MCPHGCCEDPRCSEARSLALDDAGGSVSGDPGQYLRVLLLRRNTMAEKQVGEEGVYLASTFIPLMIMEEVRT